MNKNVLRGLLFSLTILIILIGCEPISVSVNSNGDVAFTRSEGTFYINLNTNKFSIVDWNYGNETIPIIVRWSPKGDKTALTVKDNKDSQNTTVYIISENNKTKLYTSSKIITQMEWSPDGNYITLAQAGEDTNTSVADIVLISVKDGMSKIILQNCGDVHKWLNSTSIAFIKIDKKNENNSDIFLGELSIYRNDSHETKSLVKAFISRTGGLDCSPNGDSILFTAIKASEDIGEFEENMTSDTYLFNYNLNKNDLKKWTDDVITFVDYSPDGKNILVKVKDNEAYNNINLAFINMKNSSLNILIKDTTDTVSSNSSSVQVYPAWYNNNNVIYWRLSKNYGSNGEYLQMMSIDITNLKKKNHQPTIDIEIHKLIESKGGY